MWQAHFGDVRDCGDGYRVGGGGGGGGVCGMATSTSSGRGSVSSRCFLHDRKVSEIGIGDGDLCEIFLNSSSNFQNTGNSRGTCGVS